MLTPEGLTKIQPEGIDALKITEENTLNSSTGTITGRDLVSATLPLKFVKNYNSGAINIYISGLDPNGAVVFVASNGSLIYPSSSGSTVPVHITQNIAIPMTSSSRTLELILPISMSSGRIYVSEGALSFYMMNIGTGDCLVQPSLTNLQDANAGLKWGFVEFSYTGGIIYANVSYVDFVSMILGILLADTDGTTQTAAGLPGGCVISICNDLIMQMRADGYPWSSMCLANTTGTPIRVLSPGNFHDLNADAFAQYWHTYVDQVWRRYTTSILTINTQTDYGNVSCRVSGDELACNGDNRGYAKPSANDIWGCNTGPFAIMDGDNTIHKAVVPRLCAAFARSTLLLDGGNVQPSLNSASYYTIDPDLYPCKITWRHNMSREEKRCEMGKFIGLPARDLCIQQKGDEEIQAEARRARLAMEDDKQRRKLYYYGH